jgi:uracil-DNA glycosylase
MSLKRKATDLSASDTKKPKADGSITSFFGAPKASSTSNGINSKVGSGVPPAAPVATPKFNKAKWVEKLTPEQKELLKLEIDTLHESWLAHLKEEVVSDGFLELKRFLQREKSSGKTVFPPEADVYSWSVPITSLKELPLS